MTAKLENAQKQLSNFLKQNPHMKSYQDMIDKRLRSKQPMERLNIIVIMIGESLQQLRQECNKLFKHINDR